MPKYDPLMKRLGRLRPDDFVSWLCADFHPQQVTFEDREFELTQRRVDLLYKVKTKKVGEFFLHLEFQGAWEKDFSIRLHEYSTRIRREFELPVKTVAVFLDSSATIRDTEPIDQCKLGDELISEFHYTKIILPEEEWENILAKKIVALFPLIPLTKIAKEQENEALHRTAKSIEEIEDKDLRSELAAVLYIIGGYKYSGTIDKIIGGTLMLDLMESKTYRETFEKGEKTGELRGELRALMNVLEIRTGEKTPDSLKKKLEAISSLEVIDRLVKLAATINSLSEFEAQMNI